MPKVRQRLYNKLKQRLQSFIRAVKSVDNIATLNARQIYILPSRWSILYTHVDWSINWCNQLHIELGLLCLISISIFSPHGNAAYMA